MGGEGAYFGGNCDPDNEDRQQETTDTEGAAGLTAADESKSLDGPFAICVQIPSICTIRRSSDLRMVQIQKMGVAKILQIIST